MVHPPRICCLLILRTPPVRLRERTCWQALSRTNCPHEDQAAAATLGEPRAEMVSNIQMRHGVEPQGFLEQLPIMLQELAGISGTGIGDDKADVEIVRSVGESRYESLL